MIPFAAEVLAEGGGWGPGAWWPIFPIFWVLFWGVLIFALFRFRARRWSGGPSGESVLAERYARGEIGETEYRDRLKVLKDNR